jgi:hypothetical protein
MIASKVVNCNHFAHTSRINDTVSNDARSRKIQTPIRPHIMCQAALLSCQLESMCTCKEIKTRSESSVN